MFEDRGCVGLWGGRGRGGSELPHIASEGSIDTEHFPAETGNKDGPASYSEDSDHVSTCVET